MHSLRSLVVASTLFAACPAALAGDIVQKRDGSYNPAIKGTTPAQADFDASTIQVVDAAIGEVKISITVGGKQVLQVQKDVAEIWLEPRDYPGNWKTAMEAFNSGDYKSAAATFKDIGAEAKTNAVVRQKALLFAARAVREGGTPAQAEASYGELLKAFPQTFYTAAACKDQSLMWMGAGNGDKALSFAETLLKLPGVSDSDRLEARFLKVTVKFREAVAKKDAAGVQKSLDEYRAIAQETAGKKDFVGVNQLARVGQGDCLLEQGNHGEAKGIFQEISERATEVAVCAAAFNGLGDCFFREGNFVEARRCFLRTASIYAEGTPGEQVARALFHAGQCFAKLQDSEDWKDRARREFSDCERRFPKSSWAEPAKRARQSLGK
jgi:TolA-binding protein